MSGGHGGGGVKKSSNWIVTSVVAIFVVLALMVLTLNGLFGDEGRAAESEDTSHTRRETSKGDFNPQPVFAPIPVVNTEWITTEVPAKGAGWENVSTPAHVSICYATKDGLEIEHQAMNGAWVADSAWWADNLQGRRYRDEGQLGERFSSSGPEKGSLTYRLVTGMCNP